MSPETVTNDLLEGESSSWTLLTLSSFETASELKQVIGGSGGTRLKEQLQPSISNGCLGVLLRGMGFTRRILQLFQSPMAALH